MKRSFYEMLGVPHDADKAQIDAAYAQLTAKLSTSTNVRGTTEAMTELELIRDGYRILSDPKRRSMYDAKLHAAETGVELMFFPEGSGARSKLGIETLIFAALASVLSYIVYHQLVRQVDEVRVEHVQTVTRKAQERAKAISLDPAAQGNPSDVRVVVEEEKQKR